jgi:hypothetical protein
MPKLQPQRFSVDVSNWQLNAPSADVDGELFFLPLFFPSDSPVSVFLDDQVQTNFLGVGSY